MDMTNATTICFVPTLMARQAILKARGLPNVQRMPVQQTIVWGREDVDAPNVVPGGRTSFVNSEAIRFPIALFHTALSGQRG